MNSRFGGSLNRPTRLLIVDDDLDVLESLRDLFETQMCDFEIRTATNGAEVENSLRVFLPDIVLMDVKLQRGSGLDLIPKLKRRIPGVICIVMTGYRDVEPAAAAVQLGVDDYLLKPINPIGLLHTLRRCSRIQKLERIRAETEKRFRAAFEQTYQWMFLLSATGKVLHVSESALAEKSVKKAQVVDQAFWETPWWDTSAALQQRIKAAVFRVCAGGVVRDEIECPVGEDRPLILDLSMKPVLGAGETVMYVLVECRDVTERRRIEEELRTARDRLEEHVAVRTAELTIAKEEAQRASRAKSEFLSRMSHQLRTPLNAIIGFSQLLETADELGETEREGVGHILTAGRHLLDLINDVLDLSRFTESGIELRLGPVAVAPSLQEVIGFVETLALERHISITHHLSDCEALAVRADAKCLTQVLLNLLSNAIKYGHEGGSVTVACGRVKSDRIRISITDTGPGLSPEQLEKLFDPFDRLGAEYTEVPGTGIGLPIVKRLMESMEGSVEVRSTPGQGSSFSIELARSEAIASPSSDTTQRDVVADPLHASPRTVLYVEDDRLNVALMKSAVARHVDVTLLVASNGEEALVLAREHRPDLIVLDIHLPDMDGYEVFSRLRSVPATSAIPVIALSADGQAEAVDKGRAVGFLDYVTKPVDIKKLIRLLYT